jgi:hypothetical protein
MVAHQRPPAKPAGAIYTMLPPISPAEPGGDLLENDPSFTIVAGGWRRSRGAQGMLPRTLERRTLHRVADITPNLLARLARGARLWERQRGDPEAGVGAPRTCFRMSKL